MFLYLFGKSCQASIIYFHVPQFKPCSLVLSVILISPVLARCVKLSMYSCGINFPGVFFFLSASFMNLHFYISNVSWTCFYKTSSHPATFRFPLFSAVVFSCCVVQPMIVQMGALQMTWQGASQLIDCHTEASSVLIFAILGRNQPYTPPLFYFLFFGFKKLLVGRHYAKKRGKVNDTGPRFKSYHLYIDMWNKILTFKKQNGGLHKQEKCRCTR